MILKEGMINPQLVKEPRERSESEEVKRKCESSKDKSKPRNDTYARLEKNILNLNKEGINKNSSISLPPKDKTHENIMKLLFSPQEHETLSTPSKAFSSNSNEEYYLSPYLFKRKIHESRF